MSAQEVGPLEIVVEEQEATAFSCQGCFMPDGPETPRDGCPVFGPLENAKGQAAAEVALRVLTGAPVVVSDLKASLSYELPADPPKSVLDQRVTSGLRLIKRLFPEGLVTKTQRGDAGQLTIDGGLLMSWCTESGPYVPPKKRKPQENRGSLDSVPLDLKKVPKNSAVQAGAFDFINRQPETVEEAKRELNTFTEFLKQETQTHGLSVVYASVSAAQRVFLQGDLIELYRTNPAMQKRFAQASGILTGLQEAIKEQKRR